MKKVVQHVLKMGLVHVYTGDGKGKTTASLGLALRVIGHGMSVYMIQFLKGGAYTGELFAAKKYLPNLRIVQFGEGKPMLEKQLSIPEFIPEKVNFFFPKDEDEKEQVLRGLEHASRIVKSGDYDLVILDEINNVLHKKMLKVDDVLDLIEERAQNTEIVLTGRNVPREIIDVADYVTNMKSIKHPFSAGIDCRKGIEY